MRYVISDIHGCSKTFRNLVQSVIKLKEQDVLYLLGDYIDKGPNSKGVLDFMIELTGKGFPLFALKGNREEALLLLKSNPLGITEWLNNGGIDTLNSFGTDSLNGIPFKYYAFIEKMPYFRIEKQYWFVHAGFNFLKDDILNDVQTMLTGRNLPVDFRKLGSNIIVHGHTPMGFDDMIIHNARNGQNICVDSGCVYLKKKGMGRLTAYCIDNGQYYYSPNLDL